MVLPNTYNGRKPIIKYLKAKFGDPNSLGIIKITNSTYRSAAEGPENLLNWDTPENWASDYFENSFFIIDFVKNFVKVASYGIRTYKDELQPIHWKVLGSNGNDKWSLIDTREGNPCLGHMGQRYSNEDFDVCKENIEKFYTVNSKSFFRYIKVIEIGSNSMILDNNVSHYRFYLNAFEIFGNLYYPRKQTTAQKIFKESCLKIHPLKIFI